jgi:hypothetical protein
MERRALIIGIDTYDSVSGLSGCVADASAMARLLERNEDGSPNYACRLWTNPPAPGASAHPVTRGHLREEWERLLSSFTGDILFYFAGHGCPTQLGGYLVTQDATEWEPGLPMNDLLQLANQSKAREVLLVLDCCFSGSLGNPPNLNTGGTDQAQLREGVTILAASRSTETSAEIGGHGLFTWLVLGALSGGAADVRGLVSAAAVYAYVEQVLGPWDQRPMYKSHASRLTPVRQCHPGVPDVLLRRLPELFPDEDSRYQLDPTYERTDPAADPDHVEIYRVFTRYRDAGLLRTVDGDDLFFTVMQGKAVDLTPQGRLYWLLAKEGRL